MHRALRYGIGLFVGVAVTAGVALASSASRVPVLLFAIAQVYAAGTAIALRFPERLRRTDAPNWASGAFVGILTFGGSALLLGVESGPTLAVAALGYGLACFGFVAGIAFERGERSA